MRILFDNGTPRGLARFLAGHIVEEARAHGWEETANGALLEAAERTGFEVLVTTDKNIRYQQNLKVRRPWMQRSRGATLKWTCRSKNKGSSSGS